MKSTNSNNSISASTTSSTISVAEPNTVLQGKHQNNSNEYKACVLKEILSTKGYKSPKLISTALQGSVWTSTKNEESVVVKIVNKTLHRKGVTYVNGKRIKVHENILRETAILKYLTANHPPSSLVKFIDFFEDNDHYFLVMENGGNSLFSFVKQCHVFIESGYLPLNVWRSFCRKVMQQMTHLLDWMHNTMRCCHLDISLENFVIQNVNVVLNQKTNQILAFDGDFQIKIIDWGVSEVFSKTNIEWKCTKFVGKRRYKAPKVYAKIDAFDPRAADCWSLGVCFFMIMIGCHPFLRPSVKDKCYNAILNGKLKHTLCKWKKIDYVTPLAMDVFAKIFVNESDRMNITEIQKHPYFSSSPQGQ